MSEKELRKPTFIKLKDLEYGRSGYNVIVKVTEVLKVNDVITKQGKTIPMINLVVADETASANAFFKGPQVAFIQKDAVIAIRNGVKRIVKGHISLEIDAFGRVTKETDDVKPNTKNNISQTQIKFDRDFKDRDRKQFNGQRRPFNRNNDRNDQSNRNNNRDYNDRRQNRRNEDYRPPRRNNDRYQTEGTRNNESRQYGQTSYNKGYNNDRRREDRGPRKQRDQDFDRRPNRQYQRPNREYQEKKQEFRQKRAPMKWQKVSEIGPGQENLNLIAKVISGHNVTGNKGTSFKCVIGDETGVVNAFLLADYQFKIGSTIALFKVDSRVVKQHIEIQLGKYGRVEKAKKPIEDVNEKFNLSEKFWVPVD